MRKIFSIVLLLCIFAGVIPVNTFANEDNYFVVTAYYSPLPNQKHYLKWNYEDEKTLNGQGIRGASGKPVFSGMLAAPGKYSFGTKVYLEGLGVGEISDRWGAIVPAGKRGYSYDRIDVWVGYGDEWLRRALYWGKRTVKGNITNRNSTVTLDYKTVPSPIWATKGLKKISSVFHTPLGIGSNIKSIKELQTILTESSLYAWEIDGVYNNQVIGAIYDFQVQNKLIENESSYGAGYWGASTRNLFFKKYVSGSFTQNPSEEEKQEQDLRVFDTPLKNTKSTKKLQEILTEIVGYTGAIDGNYKTIETTILDYQLQKEIIPTGSNVWAWVFGPKTRASLKDEYLLFLEDQKRQMELEKLFDGFQEVSWELARENMKKIRTPLYGNISTSVRELQVSLRKIGYFDYKDTAIFWVKTRNGLIAFQLDMKIIENASEKWAGVFWPKTREVFEKELADTILQQKLVEADIFEEIEVMRQSDQENEVPVSILEQAQVYTI